MIAILQKILQVRRRDGEFYQTNVVAFNKAIRKSKLKVLAVSKYGCRPMQTVFREMQ